MHLIKLVCIVYLVLCGCLKDFLRNLREPLIPTALWTDFVNAAQTISEQGSLCKLYRVVDNLPPGNRDTLGLLLQHFLRIANIPEIRMPVTNLAKIFGPIVGSLSPDPSLLSMFTETTIQTNVMEKLLSIPSEYWNQFSYASSAEREYNVAATATPVSMATPSHQCFGSLGTLSFRNNTTKKKIFHLTQICGTGLFGRATFLEHVKIQTFFQTWDTITSVLLCG